MIIVLHLWSGDPSVCRSSTPFLTVLIIAIVISWKSYLTALCYFNNVHITKWSIEKMLLVNCEISVLAPHVWCFCRITYLSFLVMTLSCFNTPPSTNASRIIYKDIKLFFLDWSLCLSVLGVLLVVKALMKILLGSFMIWS